MAEKEFVAKIVADTTQADAAINKTADSLNNLADAENNVADASKNAGAALKNIGSTGKSGVEDAENAVKSLKGATELVAGSIAAGVGSLALFGAESEKLGEVEKKVQGAIAIALGVREAAEGALELVQKRRYIQEKAVQAATKVSTAVQAAYNAVVSANPIALIVLAVAGFIVALIALKDKIKIVSDAFDFVNKKFQDFLEFLGLGVSAEEKAAAASKKLAEGKEKQYTRELALLKAKGASEKEIYEKSRQIIQEQIKQVKKGTEEYEKAKNDLAVLDAEYKKKEKEDQDKADKENSDRRAKQKEQTKKALIDKAESERQLAIQLEDDEKKRRELILKDELADLEVARQAALAQENLTAKAKKAINDKFDNDKLIAKDKATNDIAAIDKKAEDKARTDAEKAAADLKAFYEKAYSDELAAANQYYTDKDNLLKTQLAKGEITQEEYDAQQEQNTIAQLENLLQITKDAGKSTIDLERQIAETKKQIRDADNADAKQKAFDTAQFIIDQAGKISESLSTFAQARTDVETKAIQDQIDARVAEAESRKAILEEQVENQENADQRLKDAIKATDKEIQAIKNEGQGELDKIGEKAFEQQKKFAIASAVLDGSSAILRIFANAAANPKSILFPGQPYIEAAIAAVFTASKIKQIKSTSYSGGGGGATGGAGAAGIGGGGSVTSPPPITTTGTFTPLLPQGSTTIGGGGERGERVVKTYVLAGDVTDAQEAEARINQRRQF